MTTTIDRPKQQFKSIDLQEISRTIEAYDRIAADLRTTAFAYLLYTHVVEPYEFDEVDEVKINLLPDRFTWRLNGSERIYIRYGELAAFVKKPDGQDFIDETKEKYYL